MTNILLPVAQYYPQTDSRTAHADRMCFSSTMAMGVKYLWPSALSGVNADDDYLRTVLKYGDTTNPQSQIKAAATYNVKATFYKNGSLQSLYDRLGAGLPVPVGFLHHGPSSAPRGGGHWILLIGATETHGIFHDPYGELDNLNGGYPHRGFGGKSVSYTWKNWLPRWTHGGEAWFMDLRRIEEVKIAPASLAFENSWKGVKAVAKACGAKFPEVVAAQWALESSWGQHTSGKNNFFGIKGSPGTLQETKEFLNGRWTTVIATFKDYPSPTACIDHLIAMWYKDYKGYKGINRATSWKECCQLLQSEGYATDPSYPSKLIRLIEENN